MRGLMFRVALGAAVLLSLPLGAADFAAPATPPGVTVEPPVHIAAMEAGKAGRVTQGTFADAGGMTLYSFADDTAQGQSACNDSCAAVWPALAAQADAKPVGDWSLVARADGAKQWAYKGAPLYRSAKDSKPGEMNGKGADGGKWQIAGPQQSPDEVPTPAAITLRPSNNALGDVFVDYRGMTLYTSDGDTTAGQSACVGACAKIWRPLQAARQAGRRLERGRARRWQPAMGIPGQAALRL